MSFAAHTTEAHERRITRCKSCRARIIWLKTALGHNMPVDADTVECEHDEFMPEVHMTHFATCVHAAVHRRRR